jgi:hypothetical protein
MISGGEHMRTQIEQIFRDSRRNPETPRRILTIDYHQIDFPFSNHVRQMLAHDAPSGAPENIAYKKNLQGPSVSRT